MKPTVFLWIALSVLSCSATVWDRPDTASYLALKPKALQEADLSPLGPGAAWALGTVFSEADRSAEAELLWKRSLDFEGSPFRERAGLDLFDLYSAKRDWVKAEAVARRLVSFDGGRTEFQRRLFEAYYFQKKDGPAWDILKAWKPGTFTAAEELENQLFRGVLAARSGRVDEASVALRDLIFDRPASVLHFRAESFFQEDESRYDLLGPGGREAVAFQSLVYRGVAKDLQSWLKGRPFPDGFWNHKALIAGLEAVFKAPAHAEAGLGILNRVAPGLTGSALFAWEYARGRLQRSLGWWAQARDAFARALALAGSQEREVTSWNWLNAWVQTHPQSALGPFLQVYAASDNPGFYSDVLESWVTELVQTRQWGLLAAAWRNLRHRLADEDKATLAFILSRLATHGLLDLRRELITETPDELLSLVIQWLPFSYEALVARAALNQPLTWPSDTAPSVNDRGRDNVTLWETLVRFGQAQRVAAEVADFPEPLDPAFVERVVPALQSQEQYRPSLQILYRLLKDPGRVLTLERARLLYPVAYSALVTDRAQAENLDPSLLLGLMREESSFDPAAQSWVGAQGLTQLMPPTAAETARSLRLKTYDLANPVDNLKIGARYLSTMIRSQGRIYLALMAYNAGGGRIKPWKEAMGRLPEEIFVEAAPIDETRGYVKKILTSTVMTGVLHFDRTIPDMVKLIYPGFDAEL